MENRPENDPSSVEPGVNLGDILRSAGRRFPDEWAVRDGSRKYTFSQVCAATSTVCDQIKSRRPERSTTVALLIPNCPEFSICYFAALWADTVVVPINPLVTDRELIAILHDCQAPILMVLENQTPARSAALQSLDDCQVFEVSNDLLEKSDRRLLNPFSAPNSTSQAIDDTAVILYTSGSTGDPKGVELTHGNLLFNAKSVSEEKFSTEQVSNILGPGHVALAALPLSHAFGQTNMQNGMWYHGGAIAYQQRFEPVETCRKIEENQATYFAGVPTMYVELLKTSAETSAQLKSLKFCVCGGAALSASLKSDFSKAFGLAIQESYGLTETSPMISCQPLDRTDKVGCVGRPISGVQVRIVDPAGAIQPTMHRGELQVRGHNVFRRYLNQPVETRAVLQDGWFSTGDIALIDEDDDLWIVDRKKEMINRGGYSIYPSEIEAVISQLDAVREVAVIGVPDQTVGEEIKAFVVPADLGEHNRAGQGRIPVDQVEFTVQAVKNHCKVHLASYKCPRIIEIMEQLPRGATGKIDRQNLKAL